MNTGRESLLFATALMRWWNRRLGGNRHCIRGRGNAVLIGKSLLTRTRIQIRGTQNTVTIGNGCRLHDLEIIMAGDNLRLKIADNCQLRGKLKLEDAGSAITIGAGTTLENGYLGAYEGRCIRIGNDCMLSGQVGVRTGDMHSIVDAITGKRLNPAGDVTLGPHVWLCRGATVLKNCTVGAHAVIGAFSTVVDSIPPHALAVGTPAKVIREQIDWRRERLPPAELQ